MTKPAVGWWRRVVVLTLAIGVLLALGPVSAQDGTEARVARVAGRVEVLPKGQSAWVAATVGLLLPVGTEIRAFQGGWAEIRLSDGSSAVLAENSRLVVTRLDVDPQSGRRASVFHLVVGKVRAAVAKPAIVLIRFRQSDFAITTPTAVAAARGTEWSVMHLDITKVLVHSDEVICLDLKTNWLAPVSANTESSQCGQAYPISKAYEQLVFSPQFPDGKPHFDRLTDGPTPNVTNPGQAIIGFPLMSYLSGPLLFTPPSLAGNRGPEVNLPTNQVSPTSTRHIR